MLDLKNVIKNYPQCLATAERFRGILLDLYPVEKAKIFILVKILTSGIASEIQKVKIIDKFTVGIFCAKLENEFGINSKLALECILIWADAYEVLCEGIGIKPDNEYQAELMKKVKQGYRFISAGNHFGAAMSFDGEIIGLNGFDIPYSKSELNKITVLSAGQTSVMALQDSGDVLLFTTPNTDKRLRDYLKSWHNIKYISNGPWHMTGLQNNDVPIA